MAEATNKFKVDEYRCNFSSKTDLIAKIKQLNLLDYDIIAFVRGGGDKASMEIFNDSDLGNEALRIKPLLVTAVGHTTDETLMDKVADRKFALPHDYGNSLKVWVDQAIEEQSKSKSIFIEQVKKDLTKTFEGQITTIQKQLEAKNKEFETAQLKFKEMVEQNKKEKEETIQGKEKLFEESQKALTEQITMIQKQLETKNKEFETAQSKFNEMIEQNKKDKEETIKGKEKLFEESQKTLIEQITMIQKQLETKNKEFEIAQSKFNEMFEQNKKDKEETIQAKQKFFEESQKTLIEQIKSKDESIKLMQINTDAIIKAQVSSAVAEMKTKYDIANSEKENLSKQLNDSTKKKSNMIIYIIIALVIGLVVGLILRN